MYITEAKIMPSLLMKVLLTNSVTVRKYQVNSVFPESILFYSNIAVLSRDRNDAALVVLKCAPQ